jgi:chromosome segregation ATPase
MLEYLKATNFQVFKELHLEFHPGLNVIIAPTDSGKSSIVRLLDWIFTNHQLRYNYQNDDSKGKRNAKVIGEIGIDGHVVKRVKGTTDNYYQLDNDKPLKAIGNNVPDNIKQLFNMDSINIHRQHSKHFLLGETSGDVGKFINGIVNLDVLSESPKYAESEVKSARKKVRYAKDNITITEKELKNYKWVDDFEVKLSRIEKRQQILDVKIQERDNLEQAISIYDEFKSGLEQYTYVDDLVSRVNKLLVFRSDIVKLTPEIELLQNAIGEAESLQEELDLYQDFGTIVDRNNDLLKQVKIVSDMKSEYNQLSTAFENYEELQSEYNDLSLEVEELHRQFDELMPDQCPLCGK